MSRTKTTTVAKTAKKSGQAKAKAAKAPGCMLELEIIDSEFGEELKLSQSMSMAF